MQKPKVTTYLRVAANGRRIGKATRVTFPDGRKVDWMELLPAKVAIAQSIAHLEREAKR